MDLRSIAAGEVLEDRRSGKTYLVEVVSVPSPDAWDERFADTDIMVRWNGAEPLPGLPAYLEKLYRPGDADAEEEAE